MAQISKLAEQRVASLTESGDASRLSQKVDLCRLRVHRLELTKAVAGVTASEEICVNSLPTRSPAILRAGVAAELTSSYLDIRRETQSDTVSPLLISGLTNPSIIKVGDMWIPFWRAYLQCHLISRSRSGIAKALASFKPL